MNLKIAIGVFILVLQGVGLNGQGTWTQKNDLPIDEHVSNGSSFTVNGKAFFASNYLSELYEYDPLFDLWTQKSGIPTKSSTTRAFSIDTCGYAYNTSFWQYCPTLDIWTQKADCPGGSRIFPICFDYQGKGYYGLGGATSSLSDLWEYDPLSDSWTQMADIPVGVTGAFVFQKDSIVYVGCGTTDGSSTTSYTNNFWKYNIITDTWTQLNDFPGLVRTRAVAFAIDEFGYLCTGYSMYANYLNDFWKYDPTTDTWELLSNFPVPSRQGAVAFSINGKVYITGGYTHVLSWTEHSDLWEYLPDDLEMTSQMILEYNTYLSSGATITLPLQGDVDVTVNWGDGNIEVVTSAGNKNHTYLSDGVYSVAISGTLTHFGNQNYPNSDKLVKINSFGNLGLTDLSYACHNAANLTHVPEQIPAEVTNLSYMFYNATSFNQDVGNWNVSNVTNVSFMFAGTFENIVPFNHDIGGWNVSNVTNMRAMFLNATSFNQDIGNWDVSNVTDMGYMFAGSYQGFSTFNQYIGDWEVSNVTNMSNMFNSNSAFNQDIGSWDVSNVTNTNGMFYNANSFNQDIVNWDVSNVTDMSRMFYHASNFSQAIGSWDVSNVTDMSGMFCYATSFNHDIGNWDVGAVTDMSTMFMNASEFNQDIGSWDVSNVIRMQQMFDNAIVFNHDIGNWNMSSVLYIYGMFRNANEFNQDISSWDLPNVTTMFMMFQNASAFNQDIGNWDVSNVTDMWLMFENAISFDQNLGSWDVSNVTDVGGMFSGVTLSVQNYDSLLIGWSNQNLESHLNFSGGTSNYSCAAINAHNLLTGSPNYWTVTDGGLINLAPIPDISVLNVVTAECSLESLTAPTATDDCEEPVTATTSSVFPITSSETIIWTYFDNEGYTSSQTQEVIITDEMLPEIVCPSNLTVTADDFSQTFTLLGTDLDPVGIGDNCGVLSVVNDYSNSVSLSGSIFELGTTTVTWTVEDVNGNQNTCALDVTVDVFVGNVESEGAGYFSIYPNPASQKFTIDCGSDFVDTIDYSIEITNQINQIVYLTKINSPHTTIDVSVLNGAGIYYISLVDKNNKTVSIKKLVLL
ncbi:MAG: BspA family leucine-rich repeat surface protein [Bacteroidales bacterium]|nr:BspA family leucine-rich repeat surface protein [Bacteroidales bacterium]